MAKITGNLAEFIKQYIDRGYWEPLLTLDYCDENAARYPDEEAIVDGASRLTWSQVKLRSERLALKLLSLGISRDEVIVCQLPNINDFIIVRIALLKAGILNCQPATTLRHKEMEHILRHSKAVGVVIPWEVRGFNYFQMFQELKTQIPHLEFIFTAGEVAPAGTIPLREIYEQPIERDYPADYLARTRYNFDEITHIAATSGTTGAPKLVNQSDAAIKLSAKDTIRRVEMTKEDVIAIFGPISGGAANVLACYCAPLLGAKVVLSETFEPEGLFKVIERERPTVICSVPTVLVRMLNHPGINSYDLSSLRTVFYYGSPIAYHTAREVEEKLGCRLISRYGAFDIAPVSCTSLHDAREARLLTVGKAYTGCEISLCNEDGSEARPGMEGEVWVKGPTATHGFYKDDQATDRVWNVPGKEGWGCTGDMGRFDEEGNLVIVGRKKGFIIRGGQNINPREIEEILRTHAKVADVAIVGMPDPEMGERVCACVVTKSAEPICLNEIVSFFKEKLIASFKIPERIELVDRLPLVSGQKVDYRQLEQDIERKLREEGKI